MSHALAHQPAPAPAPSTSTSGYALPTPRTALPSDPRSLAKFLRLSQLTHLREAYHASVTTDTDQFANVRWSQSGAGSRQAPLALNEAESSQRSKRIRLGGSTEETKVDSAHGYDLKSAGEVANTADAYYYGPHPPPPASSLKLVLDASRGPRMFDPDSVGVDALLAAAKAEWEASQGGVPGTRLELRGGEKVGQQDGPGGANGTKAAEEEWEHTIIAQLSTTCAKRIALGRDRLPLAARLPPPSITHPPPGPIGAPQPQPGQPQQLPPAAVPPLPQSLHQHPQMAQGALPPGGAVGHAQHPHPHPGQQQHSMGAQPQHQPPPSSFGGEAYPSSLWRGSYGER